MALDVPLSSGGGDVPSADVWLGPEGQFALVLGIVILLGIAAYFFSEVAVEYAEE
jgi:hypothetical protein